MYPDDIDLNIWRWLWRGLTGWFPGQESAVHGWTGTAGPEKKKGRAKMKDKYPISLWLAVKQLVLARWLRRGMPK